MIALFTDFGLSGPYVGQMQAVLAQTVPDVPCINLFADVPVFDPIAGAHLLAAYRNRFPADTVFLCVVDPGVGSDSREPVIVRADGHWYVGPGNGLFDVVAARSARVEAWSIQWRPKSLSASFHGRDLFAPVAAMLAGGSFPDARRIDYEVETGAGVAQPRIIYIDHFGNLITALREEDLGIDESLRYRDQVIRRVRTFSDVAPGSPLCYTNSSGLLEIAVNQGRADALLSANVGDTVVIEKTPS